MHVFKLQIYSNLIPVNPMLVHELSRCKKSRIAFQIFSSLNFEKCAPARAAKVFLDSRPHLSWCAGWVLDYQVRKLAGNRSMTLTAVKIPDASVRAQLYTTYTPSHSKLGRACRFDISFLKL